MILLCYIASRWPQVTVSVVSESLNQRLIKPVHYALWNKTQLLCVALIKPVYYAD